MSDEIKGMALGLIGVAIFSLSLPMTRVAVVGGLDTVFVAYGRAVVAASNGQRDIVEAMNRFAVVDLKGEVQVRGWNLTLIDE